MALAIAQDASNKITPLFSVSPSILPAGQLSSLLLILSNANSQASEQLRPGDTFTFRLDTLVAEFVDIEPAVTTSRGFLPIDWRLAPGRDSYSLQLTYISESKPFTAGDYVSVRARVAVGNAPAAGSLHLELPNGLRFSSAKLSSVTLTTVDFPLGPSRQLATAYIGASGSVSGSGLAVSRISTGRFHITYEPAFSTSPTLMITVGATSVPFFWSEVSNGPTQATIVFRRADNGRVADPETGFYFLAIHRGL